MRSLCWLCSLGTCSAWGSSASTLPRSTVTWRGSRCCTIPVTMSPLRPSYSPKVTSRSASRSRCSFSSSSWAYTVTSPLSRSTTTRASSGAFGRRLYAAPSALSSAVITVSSEMPFSRSRKRSSSIGMFTSPSSRQGCGKWGGSSDWLSPRQHHPSSHHVGQRHPDLAAAHLERHQLVVRGHHGAPKLRPRPLARGLAEDLHLVAALAAEIPSRSQRTVEPRGGHLEDVAARQRIGLVELERELLGHPLHDVGVDSVVRIQHHPEDLRAALTAQGELEHLDPVGPGDPLCQLLGTRRKRHHDR